MKTETLATAFTAALNRIDRAAPPPAATATRATGNMLIDALRFSATDRDQIVLRRIGLMTAAILETPATTAS